MRVPKYLKANKEGWQKARDAKYPKASRYDIFKRRRT
jgi:hypothetical protein